MQYESLTSFGSKVIAEVTFLKSRSKVKVTRSEFLVPTERPCHKESTYVIWKPYL